jgi:hypothetical protein
MTLGELDNELDSFAGELELVVEVGDECVSKLVGVISIDLLELSPTHRVARLHTDELMV